MPAIVDLKTEVVHRFVFELRYDLGQVFWDRAGRIARAIMAGFEGWDFDAIDINRCQLSNHLTHLLMNFGPEKLDLSQTQSIDVPKLIGIGEFGKSAEVLAAIVVNALELDSYPRIGFRCWFLFPTNNREESHACLQKLKVFRLDASVLQSLGKVSENSHRLVVDRGAHSVRVAIAPFEQQVNLPASVIRAAKQKARNQSAGQRKAQIDKLKAQKMVSSFPQVGVLLDMDAHIEDPPYPDALTISKFVSESEEDFRELKSMILESAT
jgi:hypothetical protein